MAGDRLAHQYRLALRDLTFNSKPIINNLTMLAQENVSHASTVVQALIDHFLTTSTQLKLPALYLIDSICKNVGGPYVGLFSAELVSAFSRAFQSLGDAKLEYEFVRVMKTWRGLFSEPIVRELEKRHAGVVEKPSLGIRSSVKRPRTETRPVSPSVVPVLLDLRAAVSLPAHLYDATRVAAIFAHVQINSTILKESSQSSATRLVIDDGQFLGPTNPSHLFDIDTNAFIFQSNQLGEKTDIDAAILGELDGKARIPDKRPLVDAIDRIIREPSKKRVPSSEHIPPAVSQTVPFFAPDILAALSPALSAISSSTAQTSSTISTAFSSASIEATNEDIAQPRHNLYNALYRDLPLQCKTCGFRFPSTLEGKAKMAVHLDAHFKRNMRLKELTKRIMTRDWFSPESEWILGAEKIPSTLQVSIFETANEEIVEEKMEDSKVLIGPEHTNKTCPVCLEEMELFWDDDADEWALRNAVNIDGECNTVYDSPKNSKGYDSQMSADEEANLVPFNSDWRIIMYLDVPISIFIHTFIRRNPQSDQVVVYNEKLHQIELHSSATAQPVAEFETDDNMNICSLCQRPFEYYDPMAGSIIDTGYFKLLGTMLTKYPINPIRSSLNVSREHPETAEEKWCSHNLPETAFNQGYYHRFFKEGRRLGRGARGAVFLCQHIIDNVPLGEYALKIVPIGDDKSWLLRHLKEVHILERLRNPNIIEYKHTWIEYHKSSKFGPTVPCLFILMEYANAGNLEDFMELDAIDEDEPKRGRAIPKSPNFLEEKDVLRIFLEAAQGLQHLHSLGILHRDMKPANLLLNYPRDSATKPTILLSDFGECSEIDHEKNSVRSGATGTIEFMAPELFRVDMKGQFMHDHEVPTDIWSLGMILYYLYFGRLPYSQVVDIDALKNEMLQIKSIEIPEATRLISPPMIQLLERLLSLNPERRPALKDVIKAVEGMLLLLLKTSPKMPTSFSSPIMRAITSDTVPLTNPYKDFRFVTANLSRRLFPLAVICFSGLMQIYLCYPYLPALKILVIYGAMIYLLNFMDSHILLWSSSVLAMAMLVYSRFTNLCAC